MDDICGTVNAAVAISPATFPQLGTAFPLQQRLLTVLHNNRSKDLIIKVKISSSANIV